MEKNYDRNKRIALTKNPESGKLLMDPKSIPELKEVLELAEGRIKSKHE